MARKRTSAVSEKPLIKSVVGSGGFAYSAFEALSTLGCGNNSSHPEGISDLPVPPAPGVVILHAEADKRRTILMHQRLGEFEEQ